MPWFWSDEIARVLSAAGRIDDQVSSDLLARPVAFRSEAETVEEAADRLVQDGEIPLAA